MASRTAHALEIYAVQPAAPASPRELACQLYVLAEGCQVHAYHAVGLALRNLRFKLFVALDAVAEPELPAMRGMKQASPTEWARRAYQQFDLRSEYTTAPLQAMSQKLRGQFTTYATWLLLREGPVKVVELARALGVTRQHVNREVRRYPQHFSKPARGKVARSKVAPPIPCLPPQFIALLLPWSNLRSTPLFLRQMVQAWLTEPGSANTPYIGSNLEAKRCTNPAYLFIPRARKRKHVLRDDGEWPERTWRNFGLAGGWRLVALEDEPF